MGWLYRRFKPRFTLKQILTSKYVDSASADIKKNGKVREGDELYTANLTYKGFLFRDGIDDFATTLISRLTRELKPVSLRGCRPTVKPNGDNTTVKYNLKDTNWREYSGKDADLKDNRNVELSINTKTGGYTIKYTAMQASGELIRRDYNRIINGVERTYRAMLGSKYHSDFVYSGGYNINTDAPAPAGDPPKDNPAPAPPKPADNPAPPPEPAPPKPADDGAPGPKTDNSATTDEISAKLRDDYVKEHADDARELADLSSKYGSAVNKFKDFAASKGYTLKPAGT